jgi:hypothetical protein
MKAFEILVGDLLGEGRKQRRVPLYQRPFSWGEENLDRLWNDILVQADEVAAGERDLPTHFLGAVVFAPTEINRSGNYDFIVIDGQQRLTALTLALAAIRDRYVEVDGDTSARDRINDYYLLDRHGRGDGQLRLLPTQNDRDAYRTVMLGHEPHDPDLHRGSNVTKTYEYFCEKLREHEKSEDPRSLAEIEQAVTGRLALVSITVDGNENPHHIYESLNNTGLQLSQADLVRNYLFMKLEGDADEIYDHYWLPIQKRLAKAAQDAEARNRGRERTDPLGRLLWLQLVLQGDEKARMEDLYSAQLRWFSASGDSVPKVRAYVEEVYRRSELYQAILEPERETRHAGVAEHLARLSRWNAWVAEPITLYLLDQRRKGRIGDDDTCRALSYVESFMVRRMIAGIQTNGLNRIFQSLPKQLADEPDPVAGLHRRLSVEKRRWPTDEALRELFRCVPFYETGSSYQRHFILESLEASYQHPEALDFTRPVYTVEHVLPQGPAADWWAMIREEARACDPPMSQQELHRSIVHLIGNLTLTAENQKLSNHPFERKQQIFERSHLEMNREIAQTKRWGRAEILARCDRLADRAIEIWPGPLRWTGR